MGNSLKNVLPSPEEALELEPEELAEFVLQCLKDQEPNSGKLNR